MAEEKKNVGEEKKKTENRKKIKKAAIFIVILGILVAAFAFCDGNSIVADGEEPKSFEENKESEIGENKFICVGIPVFQEPISVSGKAAQEYYDSATSVYIQEIIGYKPSEKRFDEGESVKIKFDIKNLPEESKLSSARLELCDDSGAKRTVELDEELSAKIYYLKTGTKYEYDLIFVFEDGTEAVFEGGFETKEGFRILSIEGIRNVRDFGGRKTAYGKTIKQGMLFRGTEMDGSVREEYKITEQGKKVMTEILGIKYDMDLRWSGEVTFEGSPLGEKVEHKIYDAPGYLQIFEEYAAELTRGIFTDLAKEEKYPMYMHCTYGADRTGTICFLLGAVLGMSEDDLLREYELTALTNVYYSRDAFAETLDMLKTYEGETLQEKTENYLLSVGITEDEIDAIKNIFLE